jgi:hypothetical protein
MKKATLINELGKASETLNGICGRLTVTAMTGGIPAVKEAHKMAIDLGEKVDDLINKLMASKVSE